MKTSKKTSKKVKEDELKNHLLTKFSEILKGLGIGPHLFEKKLAKSTKRLAKSISKKKNKVTQVSKPATKSPLIKPAKLSKSAAQPRVESKTASKVAKVTKPESTSPASKDLKTSTRTNTPRPSKTTK